jgi:hypothetical protein
MSRQTIIAAIAALAMTGCGGTGTQQAGQSSAQSAPPAAPQPPAAPGAQSASATPQGAAPAATQNAQQSAQQVAQGLQQLAQSFQQMAQQKDASGKPVPPVDFEKLEALLPSPAGWTKGKSKGEQMTTMVSISNAEVDYTKAGMDAHVEITDSALSQMLLAPLAMMLAAGYSERSSSGYKKSMVTNGSPGYEEWNSDDKTGEITVVVANRFIVAAKGSHLDNIESLRGIVTQVDLNKLAALK